VATSYNNIRALYELQDDYENTLLQHNKSIEIKLWVFKCDHPLVADSYHNIGRVCTAQGKHEEALKQYQKSLEINMRVYGQDHPMVADSKLNMGQIYESRNEKDMECGLFLECQRSRSPATVIR